MVWLQSCFRGRGRVRLQARGRHGLSSAKFRCDRGRPGAHNRWQATGRCTAPRFRHRNARHTAAQQHDASSQRQVPGAMLLRCRWLRRPHGSLEHPCLQAWSTDTTSNHRSKQRSRAKKADGADHRSFLVGQQLSATLRGTLHGRHSADSGTPCGEPRTADWRQQHGFQQSSGPLCRGLPLSAYQLHCCLRLSKHLC